jgi:hypothetical protein
MATAPVFHEWAHASVFISYTPASTTFCHSRSSCCHGFVVRKLGRR